MYVCSFLGWFCSAYSKNFIPTKSKGHRRHARYHLFSNNKLCNKF